MQNLTTSTAPVKGQTTPEIREAVRTLRASDFRLESEYHPFGDWESRLEMAEELRGILDDMPTDELADNVAGVVRDLECDGEDFAEWIVRCDAAERLRRVVRVLEATPAVSDGPESYCSGCYTTDGVCVTGCDYAKEEVTANA